MQNVTHLVFQLVLSSLPCSRQPALLNLNLHSIAILMCDSLTIPSPNRMKKLTRFCLRFGFVVTATCVTSRLTNTNFLNDRSLQQRSLREYSKQQLFAFSSYDRLFLTLQYNYEKSLMSKGRNNQFLILIFQTNDK